MQRQLELLTAASLLLSLAGCGEAASANDQGSLGQGLQLSSGASVTLATYALFGPNGFASAGSVPVGDSADVPITLSHLPLGQGYELELSALASDGVTECDGSATFDVTISNTPVTLLVHLVCAVPTGEVSVEATLNICPVLDGLSASPLALGLGGISSLSALAHDADNGPAPLSYAWAVNGIKLSRQTAPTLSLACTSLGELTISATVADGDPAPNCASSSSLKVSCE